MCCSTSAREDIFKRSLAHLRQDIMTANNLVQQANFLANELKKQTKYEVTLQIPPQNLSPNRKKTSFVSEPAIRLKRRGKPSQVNNIILLCLYFSYFDKEAWTYSFHENVYVFSFIYYAISMLHL